MADQTIMFKIGSLFKGEGFQKAQAAVKGVNDAVKKSTGVVSLLASNLGMLDAKYARATNAVTGMITALTNFNPMIAAVQVGMTTVSAVIGKLNDKLERQKKYLDDLSKYYASVHAIIVKTYSDEQAKQMEKHLKIVENIGKEFDTITRAAKEFTAAINKLDATRDAGGLIQMQIDKIQAVAEASGANAGLVAAQKDYEIVLRENAIREKRAGEAIDAANRARLEAQGRVETANNQIAELDYQYQQNLEKLNSIGNIDANLRKQLVDDNKAIMAKRKAIEEGRDKAEEAITTAEYAVKQANEEMANAVLQGKLERIKAQQVVVDAEDAVAKELEKQKEELKKERERKAKERADALKKERADVSSQLKEAQSKQKEAESNLKTIQGGEKPKSVAEALEDWNKNLGQNLVNQRIQDFFDNGGLGQIAERLILQNAEDQKAVAEAAIAAGIKDGTIRTKAQADRAGRDAARAQRDYASSKQARQEAQDERRRQQLAEEAADAFLKGRQLDPRKQAELDRLNQIAAGKNAQKAALDAAKKAEAEAKENLKKTAKNVEKIQERLDAIDERIKDCTAK